MKDIPEHLKGGGPLIVEDLEATLKLVTFECGYPYTETQLLRLLNELNDRGIYYILERIPRPTPSWLLSVNAILTIKDRSYKFAIYG
jgi:hypothetical protein